MDRAQKPDNAGSAPDEWAAGANGDALSVRLIADQVELPQLTPRQRTILVAVLAAVGLVSLFLLGWLFSSPATFQGLIDTLDEKRNNVMLLMSSAAGLSSAITFIPDDACTPIANELADLSSDFLVVLVAIYLEKYALTVIGFITFRILVPVSCVLGIIVVFLKGHAPVKQTLVRLATRLTVLGLVLFLVVPASVCVSGLIDSTYETSVAETVGAADQATKDIEGNVQEDTDSSWNPLEFLAQVPEKVSGLIESAQNALGDLVEAFAIMLITSCVIPILVLLFFLWLARVLLGANINLPLKVLGTRTLKMK